MNWKKVNNKEMDTPNCYETGAWDGKRSDVCALKDDQGRYYVARMYSGCMDGSYFYDWIEEHTGREIQNVVQFVDLSKIQNFY